MSFFHKHHEQANQHPRNPESHAARWTRRPAPWPPRGPGRAHLPRGRAWSRTVLTQCTVRSDIMMMMTLNVMISAHGGGARRSHWFNLSFPRVMQFECSPSDNIPHNVKEHRQIGPPVAMIINFNSYKLAIARRSRFDRGGSNRMIFR